MLLKEWLFFQKDNPQIGENLPQINSLHGMFHVGVIRNSINEIWDF